MSKQLPFDPYIMLGVPLQADATEIKKAYRQMTHRFHPDANPNLGAQLHFRDIILANEALTESTIPYIRRDTSTLPRFATNIFTSKLAVDVLTEPQVVYVLLEITPKFPEEFELKRYPMNLALVLDRSSSMKGARLNRVKVAARQIIEQLQPEDRISIISYSDRADILLPSQPVHGLADLRALINTVVAGGGTEIYNGLEAGYEQVKFHFKRNIINHIILITDGRTYGDEHLCLDLADEASKIGIGISAMGIGDEWNDEFLDMLATRTGGSSAYINSPTEVVNFLKERVTSLGESFAERLRLIVAPDPDVQLEFAFRLSPNAQPLDHDSQPMYLGPLEGKRPIRILLQFQLPANMEEDFRSLARFDVTGDILAEAAYQRMEYKTINDQSIDVIKDPPHNDPPPQIIDALGKLTIYRMQQRIEEAATQGQIAEATRRLQNLATRLLEMGQDDLAHQARVEATRILKTNALSEEGRKALKFGTRRLLLAPPKSQS